MIHAQQKENQPGHIRKFLEKNRNLPSSLYDFLIRRQPGFDWAHTLKKLKALTIRPTSIEFVDQTAYLWKSLEIPERYFQQFIIQFLSAARYNIPQSHTLTK
jgi:hypothetical protein